MVQIIRVLWFWQKVWWYLLWKVLLKNNWHMIVVDLEMEVFPDDMNRRRRFMAKKSCDSLDFYIIDIPKFIAEEEVLK